MSDTVPIVPPSAPPSYTESQECGAAGQPPPYTVIKETFIVESTSPGYQRIEVIEQPVETTLKVVYLGSEPCRLQCPRCGNQVQTITAPKVGVVTFVSAALCFLFCIVCTFLPFCVEELQDVEHFCPVCKRQIGVYARL